MTIIQAFYYNASDKNKFLYFFNLYFYRQNLPIKFQIHLSLYLMFETTLLLGRQIYLYNYYINKHS